MPVLDIATGGRNIPLKDILLITLKMQAVISSETIANFYRPTRCHAPQNIQLYEHCRKELDESDLRLQWLKIFVLWYYNKLLYDM
jgi:hypothetical protein